MFVGFPQLLGGGVKVFHFTSILRMCWNHQLEGYTRKKSCKWLYKRSWLILETCSAHVWSIHSGLFLTKTSKREWMFSVEPADWLLGEQPSQTAETNGKNMINWRVRFDMFNHEQHESKQYETCGCSCLKCPQKWYLVIVLVAMS